MLNRRSLQIPAAVTLAVAALVSAVFGISAMARETNETMVEHAMAGGGYVIYLRHADRLGGPKEPFSALTPLADFSDCARQRNLSEAGRGEAVRIGRVFQSIGVPVGAVFALPLCRTRDTARLAFGVATLERRLYDPDFVGSMLATLPANGTNTVLVDTEDQVRRLAGVNLAPGEAAVFKPDGNGGFRYDGTLDRDDLLR